MEKKVYKIVQWLDALVQSLTTFDGWDLQNMGGEY